MSDRFTACSPLVASFRLQIQHLMCPPLNCLLPLSPWLRIAGQYGIAQVAKKYAGPLTHSDGYESLVYLP